MTDDYHPDPVRILHIASGDLWAGAETQVFNLLRALHRRRDVQVRAVILNPSLLANRLVELGIEVDVFDESRLGLLKLLNRVIGLSRKWHPDIIHSHRRKENLIGGFTARATGAVAVATIHGRAELQFSPWQFRRRIIDAIHSASLRFMHAKIVTVSSELATHYSYLADRTIVIPNGIDVDATRSTAFQERQHLPGTSGHRLAFVGRLVPVKQVENILEAVAALPSPEDESWSLFVIGDGPLRGSLEAYARKLEIGSAVYFLGFQPDPLPLLAQMDLLVFASAHEGLPMTALEALALGVPIVSPPIGGLTCLIERANSGQIASSTQPAALAQAICTALMRRDLALGDRESILPKEYSIHNTSALYVQMYSEILLGRRLDSSARAKK